MTALPRRVLGYTTNLTTPKVAVVLELGRRSWMPWRQWRRVPEIATMLDLWRWNWSIMIELGVR